MSIAEQLIDDPIIKKELRTQILKTIKSTAFSTKLKSIFITQCEKEMLNSVDELFDNVWEDLQKQFAEQIKKNFSLLLNLKSKP